MQVRLRCSLQILRYFRLFFKNLCIHLGYSNILLGSCGFSSPFGSTSFWLMMIPEILLNFHKLTVHCFRNSSPSAAHPYIIRSCLPLIPFSFPSSNVFLILLHATTIFSLSGKNAINRKCRK